MLTQVFIVSAIMATGSLAYPGDIGYSFGGHEDFGGLHGSSGHEDFGGLHGSSGHEDFGGLHGSSGHEDFGGLHGSSGHEDFGGLHGSSGHELGLAVKASGGDHEEHAVDYYAPAHYSFSYGVFDHKTGDIKHQKETREGDTVKGEYSLHEADGTIRTVKYTADKHDGFNAQVIREGHAFHPKHVSHHDSHGDDGHH